MESIVSYFNLSIILRIVFLKSFFIFFLFLVIKDGNDTKRAKLEDIVDPKHLYDLPAKYKVSSKVHREDGLLSAQMLNGIPEVDLGINSKLKNIERTETAKRLMGSCFKNI